MKIEKIIGLFTFLLFRSFFRFCGNGSTFVRGLSLGSIQFCSHVQTALLPPLSKTNSDDITTIAPSLAAGKQLFLSLQTCTFLGF